MTPVMVPGVASRASAAVNRSRPPVFSISEISTVTPLIITITDHGMFFTASL